MDKNETSGTSGTEIIPLVPTLPSSQIDPPQGPSGQVNDARVNNQVSGSSNEGDNFKKRLLSETMLKTSSVALVFIIGIVIAILFGMNVEITPVEKTPAKNTSTEKNFTENTPDEKIPVVLLYAYFVAGIFDVAICIGAFLNFLLISTLLKTINLVKKSDIESGANFGDNSRNHLRTIPFQKLNTLINSTWILTIFSIIVFIIFIDLATWVKLWNVADNHGKFVASVSTGILAIVLAFCFFALWDYFQMSQKCTACLNFIKC